MQDAARSPKVRLSVEDAIGLAARTREQARRQSQHYRSQRAELRADHYAVAQTYATLAKSQKLLEQLKRRLPPSVVGSPLERGK